MKQNFDLPPIGLKDYKIEINSDKEAVLDGCKGIIEYSETVIKLNAGVRGVSFSGSGLFISSYDGNTAVVCGKITDINFF